jgi:hypothetical protein
MDSSDMHMQLGRVQAGAEMAFGAGYPSVLW